MENYRYRLDTSSQKFICPKCEKKTFVRFVETETLAYLSNDLGRCDRESNCGYFSRPTGMLMSKNEKPLLVSLPTSFHGLELVEKSMMINLENNFVQFLKTIFFITILSPVSEKANTDIKINITIATIFFIIPPKS